MERGTNLILTFITVNLILVVLGFFVAIKLNEKYESNLKILQEGIVKNNNLIGKFDFSIKQNKDSIYIFDKKIIQLNQKIIVREKQINNIQNSDSLYIELKNVLDSLRNK